MGTVTISRRIGGIITNNKQIPNNPFQLRENNERLTLSNELRRNPLTRDFSSNLDIQNNVPDNESITVDFVGITLTPTQETDAITVLETFRDKIAFTTLDQLNIDSKQELDDALEQVGDVFDEDTIDEQLLPDFCAIRAQFETLYLINGWNSFSVGEKRILIADWLIPTDDEIIEVFPGGAKRQQLFKLFANKANRFRDVQRIEIIRSLATDFDRADFDLFFKREFATGKADFTQALFISRSNTVSPDALLAPVLVPIFGNTRTDLGNLIEILPEDLGAVPPVLANTQARVLKDAEVDLEYSIGVNANNNTRSQITVLLNDSNIDGQGMRREKRGRSVIDHPAIRVSLTQNDILKFELSNNNAGATGVLTALSGKAFIRIEEAIK